MIPQLPACLPLSSSLGKKPAQTCAPCLGADSDTCHGKDALRSLPCKHLCETAFTVGTGMEEEEGEIQDQIKTATSYSLNL